MLTVMSPLNGTNVGVHNVVVSGTALGGMGSYTITKFVPPIAVFGQPRKEVTQHVQIPEVPWVTVAIAPQPPHGLAPAFGPPQPGTIVTKALIGNTYHVSWSAEVNPPHAGPCVIQVESVIPANVNPNATPDIQTIAVTAVIPHESEPAP
jgi:hypothetical protein